MKSSRRNFRILIGMAEKHVCTKPPNNLLAQVKLFKIKNTFRSERHHF